MTFPTQDTGAHIKVYTECAPMSTERVVQINGSPKIIVRCVEAILEITEAVRAAVCLHLMQSIKFKTRLLQYYEKPRSTLGVLLCKRALHHSSDSVLHVLQLLLIVLHAKIANTLFCETFRLFLLLGNLCLMVKLVE
jgi:hypothetical protein